jgi:hypothetical protein
MLSRFFLIINTFGLSLFGFLNFVDRNKYNGRIPAEGAGFARAPGGSP